MSRRILVTGGAGFIGSHLVDALLERGDEVVVLDNLTSGSADKLPKAAQRLHFIEGDIRDIGALDGRIGPVDTIVHLAALISGYDSLNSPDEYEDVNVRGLLRVIEFVTQRAIPRIVFASSSTVYGNNLASPLSEEAAPAPATVYALTKLAGEHLLAMYGAMRGFSHCSLRLFNVYGPRQAVDHPYANVTCKFSHAAANGLGVRRYGDGEQTRDFIYVSDVVRAFLAVLGGSRQPIYNVGTGEEHSINGLLGMLERISGRPIPAEDCGPWPNDIRSIRADIGRIAREFGFAPAVGLREGLEATVQSFRS